MDLILKAVCDPAGPDPCSPRSATYSIRMGALSDARSNRYRSGIRECTTDVFNFRLGARRDLELIGPATFIWDCRFPGAEPIASRRIVLIRVHPSICAALLAALQGADASEVESIYGHEAGEPPRIRALERALLTFEVTGKRATEVIKSVLQPTATEEPPANRDVSAGRHYDIWTWTLTNCRCQAFKKLSSVAGPSSVPAGMIFGLMVHDPRLR